MKIKIVKRKFYNQWNYKISFFIQGSNYSRFVRSDYTDRIDPCFFQLTDKLSLLDQTQYAKRVESNTTDIYLNDKTLFDDFCNCFPSNIKKLYSVNPEIEKFKDINHVIISKKYPHDKYKFKVFLKPHKIKDRQEKVDFMSWLSSQNSKIKISNTVKLWFIKTDWNWDRRYMYVEDEQTLLMLKLRKTEAIGTIYNYVLCDK